MLQHAARLAAATVLAALLVGCGSEDPDAEPTTYRVVRPTDLPPPDPHAGHDHAPGEHDDHAGHDHPPGEHVDPPAATAPTAPMATTGDLPPPTGTREDYAWTMPAGWTEAGAGGMRMATITIAGTKVDGSLVQMRGDGGQLALNVNRWRSELGLPPLAPPLAEAEVQPLTDAAMPHVRWLAIESEKAQTLAAIIPTVGSTLFVKLRGPKAEVAAQREAFLAFVASIRPVAGQAPE
jgi:hypothetical protein